MNADRQIDRPETGELIDFTAHLATTSADIIKRYFRSGYTVELKSDQTPVTIADREAEKTMRALIAERFPTHGVLGEEYGHYQPEAAFQWVLDPIDGTKAFVSGSYLFGTLIALLHNGRPIIGVINQPLLGDFLVGDGQQTWLNGSTVSARPCQRIEDAILLNTSHWNVGNYHNGPAFDALTRRVQRYNNWGDCHGYYLVATGGADIMTDPILSPWDLMALIPIIEGAGGTITDWYGNDPIGGQGAVASGGMIHSELIHLLNPETE